MQALTELPLLPELVQIPAWTGSLHESPLSIEHLAAILAVPEHAHLLVEIASSPSSSLRSHAAAVAAFLRIDAVIPALEAMLDAPMPVRPWMQADGLDEKSGAGRARLNRYTEAIAAWRTGVVALASFDRRDTFPRLTAILFDPPDWFAPLHQLDPQHDRDELRRAREAVYRMLVRAGSPSDWESLTRFEAKALANPALIPGADKDEAQVALAVVRDVVAIMSLGTGGSSPGDVDQVAVRGDRARARLRASHDSGDLWLRVSLRRQNGFWRVDDHWPCSSP